MLHFTNLMSLIYLNFNILQIINVEVADPTRTPAINIPMVAPTARSMFNTNWSSVISFCTPIIKCIPAMHVVDA